jgi:hypothetical protein
VHFFRNRDKSGLEITPDHLHFESFHPLWLQSRPQHRYHCAGWLARLRLIDALTTSESERLQKIAVQMAGCCACPALAEWSDGSIKASLPTCRKRCCPHCDKRRSRELALRVEGLIKEMNAPRFLTITLKSTNEPLRNQVKRMRESFAKLRRTKVWKRCVIGGIYGVEITRNPQTRAWHPHLHIVFDGLYAPQKELSDAWLKATGDSSIIDIRRISDRRNFARYITKYILKGDSNSKDRSANNNVFALWPYRAIREYVESLIGARMIHTFGSLHNVKVEEEEQEESVSQDTILCPAGMIFSAAQDGDKTAASIMYDCISIDPKLANAFGVVVDAQHVRREFNSEEMFSLFQSILIKRIKAWHKAKTNRFEFISPDPPILKPPEQEKLDFMVGKMLSTVR